MGPLLAATSTSSTSLSQSASISPLGTTAWVDDNDSDSKDEDETFMQPYRPTKRLRRNTVHFSEPLATSSASCSSDDAYDPSQLWYSATDYQAFGRDLREAIERMRHNSILSHSLSDCQDSDSEDAFLFQESDDEEEDGVGLEKYATAWLHYKRRLHYRVHCQFILEEQMRQYRTFGAFQPEEMRRASEFSSRWATKRARKSALRLASRIQSSVSKKQAAARSPSSNRTTVTRFASDKKKMTTASLLRNG